MEGLTSESKLIMMKKEKRWYRQRKSKVWKAWKIWKVGRRL